MAERREYELTPEQDAALERAMTTPPPIIVPGQNWQQVEADREWQRIADYHGFDWTTVQPTDNPLDRRHFTAIPRI